MRTRLDVHNLQAPFSAISSAYVNLGSSQTRLALILIKAVLCIDSLVLAKVS